MKKVSLFVAFVSCFLFQSIMASESKKQCFIGSLISSVTGSFKTCPFKMVNNSLQQADNFVNEQVINPVINQVCEYTNQLSSTIVYVAKRPVTVATSAAVVYALYHAYHAYETKK